MSGNPALRDYVPVHERLGKFWGEHAKGRIITVIVSSDPIIVRAEVYRDGEETPAATGHATDDGGMRGGSRADSYEKTETAAVGRALAFLGYEIKHGIASREEMQRVEERQNQPPATRRDEAPAQPRGEAAPDGKNAFGYVPVRWPLPAMFGQPSTEAQGRMVVSKALERGFADHEAGAIRLLVASAYELSQSDADTKAGYSLAIDFLINADDDSVDALGNALPAVDPGVNEFGD